MRFDGHPRLVLVVEDEHENAMLLQFVLEENGYRVAVAPNGRVGLALLAGEKPAAILSDFVTPEVSGGELGLTVRANPLLRDIPFVMLRGTSESNIRETFADYDAFIEKPFSPEVLVQVVADLVHHGRPGRR